MLSPHLRVADVLEWSPLVTRLLFEMRVGCIGCGMNKFCTLEDLCARHGLDLDRVSFEILDAINKSAD